MYYRTKVEFSAAAKTANCEQLFNISEKGERLENFTAATQAALSFAEGKLKPKVIKRSLKTMNFLQENLFMLCSELQTAEQLFF